MLYYRVFVNEASYKSNEPLIYAGVRKLKAGAVVLVPLKNKLVCGFIESQTSRPGFKTKAIETIFDLPALPVPIMHLAEWLLEYYPSSIGITAQQFVPRKLSLKHHILHNNTQSTPEALPLPELTTEQKNVLSQVRKPGTYLLHGETGSGKTRVYIEAARSTLSQNRSVLILTPEIGLTPQLANDFKAAFGDTSVVTTHSRLTEKERTQAWLHILSSPRPLIVIGPRSALFSPLANIGLIVMDESHEPTYKQDQLPHYQTVIVAGKLASLHNSMFVLGSATPSVSDYFMAEQKKRPILRMQKPARLVRQEGTPEIKIVDIKNRAVFTRNAHLSDPLLAAIEKSLAGHKQSLLFLNRRGTARTVLCERCGWQAMCSHCNLPLTYHGDSHLLRCHTCGIKEAVVSSCPVCENTDIVLRSIGTKAIVEEISGLFPQARVRRFDADNKKAERLEQQYAAVQAGEVDILVGTQVLAKGLDLPKLNTVGVIIADTGLYFPDYTAQERTYQLLRQAVGRIGRGHSDENIAIVQSYDPKNPIIQSAIRNDWASFYENELTERRKFTFPPFCFLLKLTCRRSSAASAEKASQKIVESLRSAKLRIAIDGPMPSFHELISGKHQWQLVVKSKDRKELLKVIELLPSGWSYDIDPLNLL
jgi:primosomal protein N' (replication factor Y)